MTAPRMRLAALAAALLLPLAGCDQLRCADGSTVGFQFNGRVSLYTGTLVMAGRRLHLECPEDQTIDGWPVSCTPFGIQVQAFGADIHKVEQALLTLTAADGRVLARDLVVPLGSPRRLDEMAGTCTRDAEVPLPPPLNPMATLSLTPSHVDFPPTPVGDTSAPVTFSLTNVGQETAGASQLQISEGFEASIPSCPVLDNGGHCIFDVRFRPTVAGPITGVLGVSGTPGGARMAALSGIGVPRDAGAD